MDQTIEGNSHGRGFHARGGGQHLQSRPAGFAGDRKSTRLNSSHLVISYAVFCLKKKKTTHCLLACHKRQHVYLSYPCISQSSLPPSMSPPNAPRTTSSLKHRCHTPKLARYCLNS